MVFSRQHIAFCRKLYVAFLIEDHQHNLQSLMEVTGMPRRTLQDCIADMADIFIDCHFVQNGVRNNDGYYRLFNWGPISKNWVEENISAIKKVLFEEQ